MVNLLGGNNMRRFVALMAVIGGGKVDHAGGRLLTNGD